MSKIRHVSTGNVDLDEVARKLREDLDYVVTSRKVNNGDFGEILELEFDTSEEPVDFVLLNDRCERYSVNVIQVAARRESNPSGGIMDIVAFWLGATPQ